MALRNELPVDWGVDITCGQGLECKNVGGRSGNLFKVVAPASEGRKEESIYFENRYRNGIRIDETTSGPGETRVLRFGDGRQVKFDVNGADDVLFNGQVIR